MKSFKDYMWYLIHYPLKAGKYASDIYILFTVLGSIFDDIKKTALEVHRQGNILTATGRYLDVCGKDRNMPRLQNEEDGSYRKRLLMKVEIAQRAGTKTGLELALNSYGYDIEIEPLYKTDTERWAEFYIIMNEAIDNQTVYDFEMIKQTVMELKQASSKPNYGFRYSLDFENNNSLDTVIHIITSINFYNGEPLYLDGTWTLDGTYLLNGIKSGLTPKEEYMRLKMTTPIKNEPKIEATVTTNTMWYLDGSVKLDGSRKLNAGIWKEDLV